MEQGQVLSAGQPGRGGLTRELVRARFVGVTPGLRGTVEVRGDHSLDPGEPRPSGSLRPAAVLVPLIDRSAGFSILLTQRTAHLAAHAGQVSFPGGRMEPGDQDAVATALRETEEEVGLPPNHVEVVGRLDTYLTGTGFEITPVVGIVDAAFPMTPDPFEVAEVFEVPLDFVLDPANHERHSREWKGRLRHYFVLPYDHHHIWGATAGMLVNLAEVLTR